MSVAVLLDDEEAKLLEAVDVDGEETLRLAHVVPVQTVVLGEVFIGQVLGLQHRPLLGDEAGGDGGGAFF